MYRINISTSFGRKAGHSQMNCVMAMGVCIQHAVGIYREPNVYIHTHTAI